MVSCGFEPALKWRVKPRAVPTTPDHDKRFLRDLFHVDAFVLDDESCSSALPSPPSPCFMDARAFATSPTSPSPCCMDARAFATAM